MEFFKLLIGCVFITLKSATALECYTCSSLPADPAGVPEPNCNDPFNMEGIAKATCTGSCFARLTTSTVEELNMTVSVSERGCLPMGEACLQGCQWRSGPPEDGSPPQFGEAPPGAYASSCNYCCAADLCNAMPIAETAAQQTPPTMPAVMPVEGSRMCWGCEQTKANATAGSCASDDFNGKGATKVVCDALQCVTFIGPNDQGVDAVRRGCDPSGGLVTFCQAPGAECCTEELCNGEDEEASDGASAVASSSAAMLLGTLFVFFGLM